jgi:hypothetical protein
MMPPTSLISVGRAVLSPLMAITRKPEEPAEEGSLPLIFSNGDLTVLKEAVERLGFKDEESLLRYVLAVIAMSATRTLTVIDKDGKSVPLNPSESVLKPRPAQPVPSPQPAA